MLNLLSNVFQTFSPSIFSQTLQDPTDDKLRAMGQKDLSNDEDKWARHEANSKAASKTKRGKAEQEAEDKAQTLLSDLNH